MFALISAIDCPGCLRFYVYKKVEGTYKWKLEFSTWSYTYSFDPEHDYDWETVEEEDYRQEDLYVTQEDTQKPNLTTSFSRGEVYNVLEELDGGFRVKVITRDEKEILDLITSHNMSKIKEKML